MRDGRGNTIISRPPPGGLTLPTLIGALAVAAPDWEPPRHLREWNPGRNGIATICSCPDGQMSRLVRVVLVVLGVLAVVVGIIYLVEPIHSRR